MWMLRFEDHSSNQMKMNPKERNHGLEKNNRIEQVSVEKETKKETRIHYNLTLRKFSIGKVFMYIGLHFIFCEATLLCSIVSIYIITL